MRFFGFFRITSAPDGGSPITEGLRMIILSFGSSEAQPNCAKPTGGGAALYSLDFRHICAGLHHGVPSDRRLP